MGFSEAGPGLRNVQLAVRFSSRTLWLQKLTGTTQWKMTLQESLHGESRLPLLSVSADWLQ